MHVHPFGEYLLALTLSIGGLLFVVAHPACPYTPELNTVCIDQVYPTHERIQVDCPWTIHDMFVEYGPAPVPYIRVVSPEVSRSAPVQIDFQCHHATATICEKARRAFERAGEILADTILFQVPIRVNATLLSFCKDGSGSGKRR